MKKEQIDWEDISFLVSGKHRKRILQILVEAKTPTQIKKETDLHFNVVSRTIQELEKKGFVECLTPKQKLARFYRITSKGEKILKNIKSL